MRLSYRGDTIGYCSILHIVYIYVVTVSTAASLFDVQCSRSVLVCWRYYACSDYM